MRLFSTAAMALLLVSSACDDSSSTPDAAPDQPDAAPTADGGDEPADAGPSTLTITVFDENGELDEGADVVVHNPDGTVKSTTQTNASGVATPVVAAGDQLTVVTAFDNKGAAPRLITWVGVEPGDVLRAGAPEPSSETLGQVTVTTPGAFDGATDYFASSGCEFSSSSTPLSPLVYSIYESCHPVASQLPVLLTATALGSPLAFAAEDELALVAGAAAVTFAAWRTDFLPFTAEVTSLPEKAPPFVNRNLLLRASAGEIFGISIGGTPTLVDSGEAQVPMGVAPTYIYADRIFENAGGTRWRVLGGAMPIPATLTLDYATGLLASITGLSHDGTEPARFTTTWTNGVDGAITNDGVIVRHEVNIPNYGEWIIVMPPGSTSSRLPELPAALSEYMPAELPFETSLLVVDSSVGDYGDVRALVNGDEYDASSVFIESVGPVGSFEVRFSERSFFSGS